MTSFTRPTPTGTQARPVSRMPSRRLPHQLSEQQLRVLRTRLAYERERLRHSLQRQSEAAHAGGSTVGAEFESERAAKRDGPASGPAFGTASSPADQENLIAQLNRERLLLAEVDAALRRARTSLYGTCEWCTRPIGFPRLEAVPWARTCIHCG
jgi:DnaK suppressor protein